MRRSEAVLETVAGETSDGSEYATVIVVRPSWVVGLGEVRAREGYGERRVKRADDVDVSAEKKPSATGPK